MSTSPDHHSPQWIKRLFKAFLDSRLAEASLGDLEEKFQRRIAAGISTWKAKILFIGEGLGFLRMARVPKGHSFQTTFNIVNHTFVFFTRLVRKDLTYYLVSLLGLVLSLTSFLFITMFVRDEMAYDQFHQNKERLFRLTTHLKLSDVGYKMATSAFPAAGAIRSEIPEAADAVRVLPYDQEFSLQDSRFTEHILFADDGFLDVFSFEWLSGDKQTALKEPASIVLTAAMARKYFGNENPLGKTLVTNNSPLKVTGVMQDIPEQSHLKFKAVIPLAFQLNTWMAETGTEGRENKWFWIGAYTYVLLRETASADETQTKLASIVAKYFPERYKEHGSLRLQPLRDIHLTSDLSNEMEPSGNIMYVQLFSVVAVVILIVSAINLINLSSFKIGSRMREVGIRKFLGQNASRIVAQLALESVLLGMLAFLLAVLLCQAFLSGFNTLVQKQLSMLSEPNLEIVVATFFFIVTFICILAIIRPAMRYAFRSSRYLLYQKTTGRGHAGERNVLIGFQVCFSFVLLVFSFVVQDQIGFFRHKDLGFDKHNVLTVSLNEDFNSHIESFKRELKKSNLILDVTVGALPGELHNGWRFIPEGGSMEKPFLIPLAWVDNDYLSTLKIKLLAGENFKPPETYENDTRWPFIINKTAAMELGWADDSINKRLKVFAAGTTEIMAEGCVIGVMDDYHFESLHKAVKPVILTVSGGFGTVLIRTSGSSIDAPVKHVEKTWKMFSGKPFAYEFLDKTLDKLYTNESRLSNIILFFTVIALYLTCYGMFAMSALLFGSRLKEVAIRKVLGAGHGSVLSQFYSRYAVFNMIAILAGCPIAAYLANLWLETFQYRITLSASFFTRAACWIMVVGLLSVSYYLLRVVFSNPLKFLKRE